MQTEWIDLSEDGFEGVRVEIRERRSWAAQQRVDSARTVVRQGADGEVTEAGADFLEYGIALFEASVVSWEGVHDAEGHPLTTDRTGYLHDDFNPELGDTLMDRIEAFYLAARGEADVAAKQPVRGFDRLARRAYPDR